jgi:hypothetical protein
MGVHGLPHEYLVDIDESYVYYAATHRKRGRILTGLKAQQAHSHYKGVKLTIILAINSSGVVTFTVGHENTTGEVCRRCRLRCTLSSRCLMLAVQVFRDFVENVLLPALGGHRHCLMWDNLAAHCTAVRLVPSVVSCSHAVLPVWRRPWITWCAIRRTW